MTEKTPKTTYQAKVIVRFDSSGGTETLVDVRVEYYTMQNAPLPDPLEVDNNDSLLVSLHKQVGDAPPAPLPNDDVVLLAQYSAPTSDPGKKTKRATPFSGANAVYLVAGQNWTLDLKLTGRDRTLFKYAAIALLNDNDILAMVDPSIIINPR